MNPPYKQYCFLTQKRSAIEQLLGTARLSFIYSIVVLFPKSELNVHLC
ncbi:hypothetical protein Sta7437_0940 [Stanieria cyanosphaera PCC 7437]|uniref:Uncharacterized protein n=1 Tax=Stanieria cyanosphaera (strain ATCC 29371 / PCC 7437) TaxID=111780 RepID=K9XS74_STAC7|nr:hypothetical protein Sta7437_0940 [Stanieria cyanosphaera PCC 7437]